MMYLHASMYSIASALEQEPLGCMKSLSTAVSSRVLFGVSGCRASSSRASKMLFSLGHSPKCVEDSSSSFIAEAAGSVSIRESVSCGYASVRYVLVV
eukprot:scaffold25876_cov38-Tisochrysis_lutea.AAC.1